MLSELSGIEWAEAIDEVVSEVLTATGFTAPPVDAFRVADMLGIEIARDEWLAGRAQYVRLRPYAFPSTTHESATLAVQPLIVLHSEPRKEREHWAIAHEIGEHLSRELFARLQVDTESCAPDTREQLANHLAGRLLLPSHWFADDGRACDWDLTQLKRRYTTASHELIARRMLDTPRGLIVTVIDHGRLSWRRTNLAGHTPGLAGVERRCWRFTHQQARYHQAANGPLFVRAWAIHEPHWKREILRTECDELDDPAQLAEAFTTDAPRGARQSHGS